MSELIEQALRQRLQRHQGAGLWVVDENLARSQQHPLPSGLDLLTNRYDLLPGLAACGPVQFSDFDFSSWVHGTLDQAYYRVSKEKAVVHHVINQLSLRLKPGGRLWLLGGKQEGIKTYFTKARERLGEGGLHKLGKGDFVAELCRQGALGEPLDDQRYAELRELELGGERFVSKPGLFGWDKIDQGSAWLIASLDEVWQRLAVARPRVLDLGCGYGYLSVHCARRAVDSVTATDNNAAALAACARNLGACGVGHQVVAADAGDAVTGRFDLVICNPPFHQGFAVEGELTDRFLRAAAGHLEANGQAAFVVNRFVPLERKAAALFGEIDTFADNGRFKLVRLARPR
ncbi:class I SAM-dependent methyltransferase [Motiliproteus sediminis]|uniref:class I SAM-dependent methyltransferase n=1 Tax=Motiliproteus sediminis TaxID=1468178 RepID=UPI001AF008CF|nr:methyltransferase [Motiliproteus sediminis]